ncbi:MAG TPA: carboxypeptidase regulatory-like domain-containing protein [Terriglobales bacterium]|nr:carboxypeptidase regulatory-like domain-containing protein [Terriglobales bacterium]
MHSSKRIVWVLALFAILLVLATGTAFAQVSSASLNGVVRDPSGAVLPHANVTLRNVETAVERTTVSNDAGNYVFLNINPGRYTLTVKAQGFTEKKVNEFVLGVNQTATIDVALAVGSDTQVVTVEAEAEQLQVSNADLGTVIATKQVNDLPLNGRNFTQLLALTPGVAPISVAQNNMGGRPGGFGAPISVGSSFTFPAINGQTNRSNFFLTDGLNNFGSFQSTYAVPPVIDAIQEFKVVSHTDSAEFGSVLGGVVNVVTKSGTNDLHGSAWEYVRNNAFDSRPAFISASTPTPSFRENQFGASIGGPVWLPKLYNGRNKTFFFFSYQGLRYHQDSTTALLVPTDAELSGDFSQSTYLAANTCGAGGNQPCEIYNPFTTTRDIFPGRIIPSGLIDQRMVAWAKAIFPAAGPYDASNNSNAVDTTPEIQTQNEYNFRIDQNFGQKNTLFFRYSAINSTLSTSGGLPGIIKAEDIPGRNWGGSYVHVFNPSLILQVQYARTTNADNTYQRFKSLNAADFDSQIGFADTFAGGFAGVNGGPLIPSPGINGYANGGDNVELTPKATDTHEIKGTITKIMGNHTVVFGGGYTSAGFASPISYASLTYAAGQTGNPGLTQPGDPLASFLLNVPDGANRRNVNEQERPGGVMSWFLQDSWKVTPKLTFNAGLRYDLTFIPPYGTNATIGQEGGIETGEPDFSNGTYVLQKVPPTCDDRGFAPCIPDIMIDPTTGEAVSCDPATQTCLPPGSLGPHVVVDPRGKIPHNTSTNFGPRIGFAYRLGDKTVIRGAYGIVYDNWAAVTQMAQNFEGSWPDIGQQIANNLNQPGVLPTVTGQNPFATTGAFPAANPFNQVQWFYDPHIKNPYSEQWNFGIEREINASTTIDLNYVGSGSHRTNVGGYYNTDLTPGLTEDPARRPYPYITPTFYDRSIGTASYNAAQFEMKKRFTNGLFYQVSYTYAKSLDEGSSGWFGVEGQSLTDPYNIKGSRGPSGFDLRHTLSVSMLYQVPVGKGKRFSTKNSVLDYIIGNWQVNNLFSARSGAPFNVYWGADDRAHTGNVSWAQYLRANQVGDPYSGSCADGSKVGSASCSFNTSAFEAPPEGTFGTSGRDAYRSAPYWDLTSSIFRQFPLGGEGRQLEFRAEAFNLFNTVIFGQPGNDISSGSSFGKVTSAGNTARQMQFSLKLLF